MMLNKVVLPAPFGPMMENTRPGATARLTSSSACTPPNAIDRCSVASMVMRASPPDQRARVSVGTMPARRKIMTAITIRPSTMCS